MKRYLASALVVFLSGCHSSEPEKKPKVDVQVQQAIAEPFDIVVSGSATIYGKSEAKIASRVTAPVARLLAHKGDAVRKGQLLAVLQNADLAAQAAEAQANVSSARANLQKTSGGLVPTELSQAQADYKSKSAAYELAHRVLTRRQELLAQGAISGREAQTSQADEAQAKANLDAAAAHLKAVTQQTGKSDIQIAESNVAQAHARQQLAAANLSFSEIRSPVDGTVTDQTMFPGDMANPGTPMFSVADLSTSIARAQIPADEALAVKVGQACSFEFHANVLSPQAPRAGKITVVNQAVDPARNTIEVWCEMPNKDQVMKSGIFGEVKIAVGRLDNAVILPTSAVEFEEGTQKAKIYIVDTQKIAHLREVQAIAVDDKRVRIVSGVGVGETIITTGEYGLPDGTPVNPTEVRR